MRRSSLAVQVVLLIVSIVALTALVQAQYRASIQGVVTDPQGAVVPGATITLTDKETNRTLTAVSDDSGIYNISALPPNRYTLTVERNGFKKKTLDNLTVIAEQANAVNVQLEIGQATQTVNVSADLLPAIDTATAQISATVNNRQIQALPSFGRDPFQLVQLAPGVFGDGARNQGTDTAALPGNAGPGGSGSNTGVFATENRPQISANGGRTEANNITLDGIGITSVSWGGAAVVTPNEDSIKEIKVVSNSYDAESGRFGGAQIQVLTQNGTNQYHGSFFFKRDTPGLNAFQHWTGPSNAPQSPLRNNSRFNDWGGSVGGPILKNKLFAFFSYERIANTGISNAQGWYETPQLLASAPSGSVAAQYAAYPGEAAHFSSLVDQTCASVNLVEGVNCHMIPGQGLDIGRPLNATFALGTQDPSFQHVVNCGLPPNPPCQIGLGGDGTGSSSNLDGTADIMNVLATGPNNQTNQQFSGRLDFNATSKDLIAFNIYRVPVSSLSYNGYRVANLFHHNATNEAETVLWDHTFSPSLLNEVRVNAAGWRWNELADNPQIPLGLPQPGGIGDPNNDNRIGSVKPTDNNLGGPAGSIFDQWTYNLKDVVTKIHHSHSLKFGGEVTKLRFVQDAPWSARPNFSFNNYWDFLNDAPYKEGGTFNPLNGSPTDVRKDSRSTLLGFFAQDDWKVRPNLTVNLGLRWEYFGPISFLHDQLSSVVLGPASDPLGGMSMRLGGNLYEADKHNFGPQLGFAWSPEKFNQKLVLRGGFGIAYTGEQQAITLNGWPNVPFTDGNATLFRCPDPPACTQPSQVVYAIPSDPHQFLPYPANPSTVLTFGSNNLPVPGSGVTFSTVSVTGFPQHYATPYTYHYSLETQYDLGHNWVSTIGYQGSMSRHLTRQYNLNLIYGAQGFALNPVVSNLDYYAQDANSSSNALLTELKHSFSHAFDLDVQYRFAKSIDNESGPYDINNYQWVSNADSGPSKFDVTHAFKIWGVYSPTIFHGSNSWLEKIAGGWSISGILNAHSGFPWSPVSYTTCDIVYQNGACTNGGTTQLLAAQYLGGAGHDYSNSRFLSPGGNFPNGGPAYFVPGSATPCGLAFPQTCNNLPTPPGIGRNSLRGPRYFDLDATVSKSFGLPKMPVLGENAKLEFRANFFNLTNKLNLAPDRIDTNINDSLFGEVTGALAGRSIELQARFNF
ncbi:MAG: TonB-dependent receptor [Acidobacteriia bacterium]|nr:TonB-dependent receptor [Terriglobia bacterium]